MAKANKTEVAQAVHTGTLFSQDVPEWAKKTDARGNENVSNNDIVLPRLEIVQAQSPIKDENPDASEGLLFNTVTSEVVGESCHVIPIYFRVEYIVWKDQDAGGGFFGAFDTEQEARVRVQELISDGEDPDDLEIVDTPVHYCLRLIPDSTAPAGFNLQQLVISMPKSKAKVSRKWNSMIQIVGGDRFSRVYTVSTSKDKNKQNKTFYNFVVTPAGFPPELIYREAERLYKVFASKAANFRGDYASAAERDAETEI